MSKRVPRAALEASLVQALGNITTLTACCQEQQAINEKLIAQCQGAAPQFRDFLRSIADGVNDVAVCLQERRYRDAERLAKSLREAAHYAADGFAESLPGVHDALSEKEQR